ncbi:MAG: creatininase family protein [Armatimonadota bacterium]|nr:creatininase family protein [Armatimonadota bacterium]MDR7489230.1 creatininase family protein [Armatimonadota bacterium]MDR7492081.1 creatininase family protein [Armatimonadota bacterium]MDR7528836.1 creatininase family protein [Armatimonadota bacterium]MDR7586297.1 creatininase family protein [Armatimonadota bacterium]
MAVHLAELTWAEVGELVGAGAVVVVPVGSLEQHGPHLPLETDWRLCATVAEEACRRAREAGVPAVVTPPIWTGFSPHHMDFPGSVTLDLPTFIAVVGQVARSLWHHGFRKILFLNGHGGNANLLRSAVQQLRFEHGVRAAAANYWDFALPFIREWRQSRPGGIDHACEMETALMLAVRPEMVRMEQARDSSWFPHSDFLTGDLAIGAPVTVAFSFGELTEDGGLGDAPRGTAERGRALLEVVTERLTTFLRQFHGWRWEEPLEI